MAFPKAFWRILRDDVTYSHTQHGDGNQERHLTGNLRYFSHGSPPLTVWAVQEHIVCASNPGQSRDSVFTSHQTASSWHCLHGRRCGSEWDIYQGNPEIAKR